MATRSGQAATAVIQAQLRAAPSTVVDTPRRVFTQIPADRGHFSEPYFAHVLRGLLSEPPWYLSALLEGSTWANVAEELEGVEGVILCEESEGT